MNKLLLLFLFIPLVFATDYSGDYEDRVIEDMIAGETMIIGAVKECIGNIKVDVDADLEISDNEINFTDCERTREFNSKSERWECPCDNPFDIEVMVKKNTINKYDFDIDYSKTDVVIIDDNNGGGGGSSSSGGGSYYNKDDEEDEADTKVINKNDELDKNTKSAGEEVIAGSQFPAADGTTDEKNNPTKPPPTETSSLPNLTKGTGGMVIMVFAIIIMILGGIGILLYKFLFVAPDDNAFDEDDVDELVYDIGVEDSKVFNKTETDVIIEQVEKPEMSDEEMESIVGDLRKDDKPKVPKKLPKIVKKKPTVKDVDDILKHLDD